jgi:hypothetical protein
MELVSSAAMPGADMAGLAGAGSGFRRCHVRGDSRSVSISRGE